MGRKDKLKTERKKDLSTDDPNIPRLPPKKYSDSDKYVSQGPNDLFEGALAKAALASLSPEDREKYRIIGEQLYGNIDFENGKVNTTPGEMADAVAYIEIQIRSGLHISLLEDNEKNLMQEIYGKEWYKKWNYIEEDLTDIVTLKPVLY